MSTGWIKVYRKSFLNAYYFSETFTKWQAWQDMLLLANHKAGFVIIRGIKVPIKRGQMAHSQQTLSDRWKWSRAKAKRFLVQLEIEHQIVQHKSNVTNLISITNYDLYQGDDTANSTADVPADSTADDATDEHKTVQQTNINKNDKKNKNEENIRIKREKEKRFRAEALLINSCTPSILSDSALKDFISWFTESSPKGRMLKHEKQQTFDMKKRMLRWAKTSYEGSGTSTTLKSPINSDDFDFSNNN